MMSRPYTTVLTAASGQPNTIHNCMEAMMRDVLLQCSGLAAIAVAVIHGALGEFKVFPRMSIEPERLRTLIRLVWQASTAAWIGGGVVLGAAPRVQSRFAPRWVGVPLACRVALSRPP